MNGCEEFITTAAKKLPELCSARDLVRIGFYTSEQVAAYHRKKGYGPDYFHMDQGHIRYPRTAVIEYLRKAIRRAGRCK